MDDTPPSRMPDLQDYTVYFLRWSEKYTKTDMVYLAGAGFWGNLNFGIVSVLALLLSVAFANFLSKDVFGSYQYLLSLSAILVAFTLGGMNSAVTQSVARGYEGDMRASVRLQLFWSIVPICIGLCITGYYLFHGNTTVGIGMIAVSVFAPLTSVYNTFSAFLNGKREFKRLFMYTTLVNVTYYVLMFLTVVFFKSAPWLILANLGANALATIYVYWRTLVTYKPSNRTDPGTLRYGKHLSIMNALWTIATQLDSVLVFHFLGAVDLAIYSFATVLPERAGGLFKFVSAAAMPKYANQSLGQIQGTIVSKNVRAALVGFLTAVVYVLIAPLIFHVLFPAYLASLYYSQLYALVIVTYAANLSVAALSAQRMQRELYIYNFINPLVLLALQIPLIIFYGIPGILIARIISNAFNCVLSTVLVLRPSLQRITPS